MMPVSEPISSDRTEQSGSRSTPKVTGSPTTISSGGTLIIENVGPRDRLWIGRRASGRIEVYVNGRYLDGAPLDTLEKIVVRDAPKISRIEVEADVPARVEVFVGSDSHLVHEGWSGVNAVPESVSAPESASTRLVAATPKDPLAPPPRKVLPPDFGTKKGQNLDAEFRKLEDQIKKMTTEAETALSTTRDGGRQTYYKDLIKALQGDLASLKKNGWSGSRRERIAEFNRMGRELYLEVKYNVNLTGNGLRWSQKDLAEFEGVMGQIGSRKLTTDSEKFSTVSLEKLPPGVGGYNYDDGRITLQPGGVKAHLIHEIGHNFENENPRWKEFKNLSGWQNVTGQFKGVGGDYDSGGAYRPYDGSATLERDGKVYKDGEKVDLNGDGTVDGIVQVHSGKVLLHEVDAHFASDYARTEPREDFAETFEEFFEHPAQLKKKCPEKFLFMVDFVGRDPTAAWQKPIIKV